MENINVLIKVVGVTYENRQTIIRDLSQINKEDRDFQLRCEPNNQYDPNAIAVYSSLGKVGYVARDLTDEVRGMRVIQNEIVGFDTLGIRLLVTHN